jgi:hypothetical protein
MTTSKGCILLHVNYTLIKYVKKKVHLTTSHSSLNFLVALSGLKDNENSWNENSTPSSFIPHYFFKYTLCSIECPCPLPGNLYSSSRTLNKYHPSPPPTLVPRAFNASSFQGGPKHSFHQIPNAPCTDYGCDSSYNIIIIIYMHICFILANSVRGILRSGTLLYTCRYIQCLTWSRYSVT